MSIKVINEQSKKQNVEKVKSEVQEVLKLDKGQGAVIITKNIAAWRTHFYSALKIKKTEKGFEDMKFTFEKQDSITHKVWRII